VSKSLIILCVTVGGSEQQDWTCHRTSNWDSS